MEKYVVLSVNDNMDYFFFTPLTCWAWRKFGWEPIVMYHGERRTNDIFKLVYGYEWMSLSNCVPVEKIDGYRSDTITQVSRLYASLFAEDEDYLMLGDIDMLAMSDYWNPKEGLKTVYGHDLTGYGHYPMCYIGMKAIEWRGVMDLRFNSPALVGSGGMIEIMRRFIQRDLDQLPQAKDSDFYKYWFVDQDLITERLKPFNPTSILRGQYSNGLAVGRVDRANWSLNHNQLIDAHLFHQLHHKKNEDKFEKVIELLYHVWPNEDFGWFIDYSNKFRKLTGNP